jgi:hypothetical protein
MKVTITLLDSSERSYHIQEKYLEGLKIECELNVMDGYILGYTISESE